jgi:hypothetical protein
MAAVSQPRVYSWFERITERRVFIDDARIAFILGSNELPERHHCSSRSSDGAQAFNQSQLLGARL